MILVGIVFWLVVIVGPPLVIWGTRRVNRNDDDRMAAWAAQEEG